MWTLFDELTVVAGAYVLRSPVWQGGNFIITCDELPLLYNRPWCRLDVRAFPTVGGAKTSVVFTNFRATTRRFGNAVAAGTVALPERRFSYYFFNSSGANGMLVRVYRLP